MLSYLQFRIFLKSISTKRLSRVLGSFPHCKVCQKFTGYGSKLESLSREPGSKNNVGVLGMAVEYVDLIG